MTVAGPFRFCSFCPDEFPLRHLYFGMIHDVVPKSVVLRPWHNIYTLYFVGFPSHQLTWNQSLGGCPAKNIYFKGTCQVLRQLGKDKKRLTKSC